MIYKYKYLKFINFQLIIFYFKSFNNSQKFIVMNFILNFYKIHLFKIVNYQIPDIIYYLIKYFPNIIIKYIYFKINVEFKFKILEN